jgi:hypothetical protein
MASLAFGLVYDLLGIYPRRSGDPPDVEVEYAPEETVISSGDEAESVGLPASFPLFVKPRWEGTVKASEPGSRVEDRAASVREGDAVIVESFDGRLWREPNPV